MSKKTSRENPARLCLLCAPLRCKPPSCHTGKTNQDHCYTERGRGRVNRTPIYGFGDRCSATKLHPYGDASGRTRTGDSWGRCFPLVLPTELLRRMRWLMRQPHGGACRIRTCDYKDVSGKAHEFIRGMKANLLLIFSHNFAYTLI